jgi:general secretion pathway protein G
MFRILALVLLMQQKDPSRSQVANDVVTLQVALGAYEVDTGRFPTTEEGLTALLTRPPGNQKWKGPYLEAKQLPKDPWGNPYVFRSPGVKNPSAYDLFSAGPDGKPYTPDDVWRK